MKIFSIIKNILLIICFSSLSFKPSSARTDDEFCSWHFSCCHYDENNRCVTLCSPWIDCLESETPVSSTTDKSSEYLFFLKPQIRAKVQTNSYAAIECPPGTKPDWNGKCRKVWKIKTDLRH